MLKAVFMLLDDRLTTYPDIRTSLAELHKAAWGVLDVVVLQLCRLQIARLLGCEAETDEYSVAASKAGLSEEMLADLPRWYVSSRFDERQKACIAFAEQFVMDVSALSDQQVNDVVTHFGVSGLVDLASAVLVLEQRHRLAATWDRILGTGAQ